MNTANITTKAWMYQRRATCLRVSLSEKSLFALPPLCSSLFSAHPLAQQKMNQSSYVLVLVNSITNPLDEYVSSYRHAGGTWFSNRNLSWRDSFSTEQPWNNLDTTHPPSALTMSNYIITSATPPNSWHVMFSFSSDLPLKATIFNRLSNRFHRVPLDPSHPGSCDATSRSPPSRAVTFQPWETSGESNLKMFNGKIVKHLHFKEIKVSQQLRIWQVLWCFLVWVTIQLWMMMWW